MTEIEDNIQKNNKEAEFFIPDFCKPQSVFLVILVAEFFAILFTLMNLQVDSSFWNLFALYSISIQNITLFSIALLCLLRPILTRYSDFLSGLLSLIIIIFVAFIFCIVVILWYWETNINLDQPTQVNLFLKSLLTSGIIGAVALRYFHLQSQYKQELSLRASAKLEALQARIRPHFLFNSMNVIASLTRIDPRKAEKAIEDLSDLFRAILDNKQDLITFGDELSNTERYLSIEKLRLGERLQIEKQINPDTLNIPIPPLSLQPLLENAVYHGIQMLPEGGCVKISAHLDNNMLNIRVTNPRATEKNRFGHGMALRNITQRLKFIYLEKAQLIKESDEDIYKVTMLIPTNVPNA